MVLLHRHFKDASRWLGFKSLRTALPLTIYGSVRGAGAGLKSANLADMLSVFWAQRRITGGPNQWHVNSVSESSIPAADSVLQWLSPAHSDVFSYRSCYNSGKNAMPFHLTTNSLFDHTALALAPLLPFLLWFSAINSSISNVFFFLWNCCKLPTLLIF